MLQVLQLNEDGEGDHMYKVNIIIINLGGGVQTKLLCIYCLDVVLTCLALSTFLSL